MAAVWFALTVPTAAYEQKLLADRAKQQSEGGNSKQARGQQDKNEAPAADDNPTEAPSTNASSNAGGGDKTLPTGSQVPTPIANVLTKTLEKLNVNDVVWSLSSNDNYYQVTFPSGKIDCEDILQELRIIGIGSSLDTKLNVLPCTLQFTEETNGDDDSEDNGGNTDGETDGEAKGSERGLLSKSASGRQFMQSIKSRLTVAQVVEGVRSSALLTFDFIMFVLLAGMLAAVGLVENSSVVLVASMLVSPMMGPILAGTFGTVIQDRKLQLLGVRNEFIGLALCLSFGFIFGLIYGSTEHWSDGFWLTEEMVARGRLRSLWVGVLIALPSGAGVALSILGGNAGSLVGVAISASLLPPVVNAGVLWAGALVKFISSCLYEDGGEHLAAAEGYIPVYSDNMAIEALALGIVSLCLTFVNIFCIVLMGIIVLKIKEVAPDKGVPETKRFWGTDIKAVRNYNMTVAGKEAKDLLTGIREELETGDPEKSEKLRQCMEEIANDPVYRTVRRKTMYRPPEPTQVTWHSSTEGGDELRSRTALTTRRRSKMLERSLSTPRETSHHPSVPSVSFNMESPIEEEEEVEFHGIGGRATTPTSPSKRVNWNFPFHRSERSSGSQQGRFVVTRAEDGSTGSSRRSKKASIKEKERMANLHDLDELVP